ncbi:MAG: hypothetical protein Q9219_000059 [cf. Caloplaca sp. 3 TL-2023]
MGRELSSFTDLQKTLAQLGFNSGNVLLRLSFKNSGTPLEVAMEQIEQYFKSVDGNGQMDAHISYSTTQESSAYMDKAFAPEVDDKANLPAEPKSPKHEDPLPANMISMQQELADPDRSEVSASTITTTGPGQRPVTVYRPPSSSTPRAAQQPFNEADYQPTIRHAKQHQARLQTAGRNKTLLSDKELAEQENAKTQKLADIKEVRIRIRFPDENILEQAFNSFDTAHSLYEYTAASLASENQPFLLSFTSTKGPRTIPPSSTDRLIADLGMCGRILVNFRWDEGASGETRIKPVLKEYLRAQARDIEVPDIPEADVPEEPAEKPVIGKRSGNNQGGSRGGKSKWLDKLIKR